MAILENYLSSHEVIGSQIQANSLPMDSIIVMQELNYRICVLETLKNLCLTAPVTTETNVLCYHYKIVDTYIGFLVTERKFGPKTDDEGYKKRETAAAALDRVILDYRKRFASFKAGTQEQYKKCVSNMINAVLSVWIQYRNTYINL